MPLAYCLSYRTTLSPPSFCAFAYATSTTEAEALHMESHPFKTYRLQNLTSWTYLPAHTKSPVSGLVFHACCWKC
ncbi:hypothetical protein DVH24_014708 [Malus domestica]|uniref:Uncharacterized protein n=1 Tax=Malus domestica TaxID=3750 RepID=A0A498J5D8_MALDO|nr:hypothetical protein DVH24_014708 [Malus domestica]